MGLASASIPSRTQILVIGGGPAGSYAATLLAREGFGVTLLERDVFPRYHIGESLLPSIHQFLSLIDAEKVVGTHGFTSKPGAAVKLNQYSREGYTDFISLDANNRAYNVIRSEFDHILLKHATCNAVEVFEGVKVSKIHFDNNESNKRPMAADWAYISGKTGTIGFDWLVDASGRAGIMSTQYLHNRKFNQNLKNVACWAYWTNGGVYAPGSGRENAPWFEALTDETGWSWYIPLHDGTVSVGFVMEEKSSISKKKAVRDACKDTDMPLLKTHYLDQLKHAPGLSALLEHAHLHSDVKSASDYSYSASTFSGDHFRIAGDAGAFIDPFFSSGVHLAFTGGLSAACTIAASIRGKCTEIEAMTFHDMKIGLSYTKFLFVVLSAYKQVKAQSTPVLQDIDEDNFDRAFTLLRPVLHGIGDVGKELTENEVQMAIDFCSHLFAPTDPEMYEEVAKRVDGDLMDSKGPILSPEEIRGIVKQNDEEAIHVLNEINARKPIHSMYNVADNFSGESFGGFITTCETGNLGLTRTKISSE